MYFVPQPYKCPKCEYEFEWSQHQDPIGLQRPYCHNCYVDFISNNVPLGIMIEKNK